MTNASKYWKASTVELYYGDVPIGEGCELSYKDAPKYKNRPERLSFGCDDIKFHFNKKKPDWILSIERRLSNRRQVCMTHMMKVAKVARKKLRKKYHRNIMLKIEDYGNKRNAGTSDNSETAK